MELQLANYPTITRHFEEKTGTHCEFIQDLRTLFLKIDGKVFRAPRSDKEIEKVTSSQELTSSYITLLEEAVKTEDPELLIEKN